LLSSFKKSSKSSVALFAAFAEGAGAVEDAKSAKKSISVDAGAFAGLEYGADVVAGVVVVSKPRRSMSPVVTPDGVPAVGD
jgi:predicted ribosome-associated RNA-binding protein Tma20